MKAGIVLALAGIWIGAQVLAGGALDKIFNSSSTTATTTATGSTSGTPVATIPNQTLVAGAQVAQTTLLGGGT